MADGKNLAARWRALRAGVAAGGLAFGLAVFASSASAQPISLYVGMHGSDIRKAHFDPADGSLVIDGVAAQVPRPTWTLAHPRLPILYSVNEVGNDGGANGSVLAFRIDRKTGDLKLISQVDAGGGGTTYLTLDKRSMTLFAANYGGGSVAAIPVLEDGSLGPRASLVIDHGSGPNKRQTRPHAHGAEVDPSGKYVIVSDLGADRVFIYPFDAKARTLWQPGPGQETHHIAPPGSGPRHTVFSPDGKYLYLLNELTAQLATFQWDAKAGKLLELDRQTTNSADFKSDSSVSEIQISPNGRFLYAGNRGENTIVVYALDSISGKPSLVQRIGSGGDFPWSFSFDPGHHWLLVANERSDRIEIFSVDPTSGKLTDTGRSVSTPKPVSITFVPGL